MWSVIVYNGQSIHNDFDKHEIIANDRTRNNHQFSNQLPWSHTTGVALTLIYASYALKHLCIVVRRLLMMALLSWYNLWLYRMQFWKIVCTLPTYLHNGGLQANASVIWPNHEIANELLSCSVTQCLPWGNLFHWDKLSLVVMACTNLFSWKLYFFALQPCWETQRETQKKMEWQFPKYKYCTTLWWIIADCII